MELCQAVVERNYRPRSLAHRLTDSLGPERRTGAARTRYPPTRQEEHTGTANSAAQPHERTRFRPAAPVSDQTHETPSV